MRSLSELECAHGWQCCRKIYREALPPFSPASVLRLDRDQQFT
jgi:hypothetical protein